jgi:hypothetical protein
MIGKVKVVLLTGFSQALSPQLVVAAARASMTRSGTAMFVIDSILPITCGARAVNLTIFSGSILAEASNLAVNSTRSTSEPELRSLERSPSSSSFCVRKVRLVSNAARDKGNQGGGSC